ncbi:MAG: tetratricopeptide repeat protein [Caulobacteraceae bacterium]
MTPAEACDQMLQLGAIHHKAGRLDQAKLVYGAVLKVRPDHADSLHLLGVVAYQQGRYDEAIELIAKAMRINPTRSDYTSNLGNALQKSGRLKDAETCYRAAVEMAPGGAVALNNLGATQRDLGRPDEAEISCRAALKIRPDYADALNNLGTALADLGRFEEAATHYQATLRLEPNRLESLNNLANVLSHLGRLDEAEAQYQKALALNPDMIEAHHNLAMTLLRAGRFQEGWREYEWRWKTRQLASNARDFTQPRWDGAPLDGRVLLIHAEQGFGDTLQFCRYASRVNGKVILEAPPALVSLMRSVVGVDTVVAKGDALPPFDVHCPMMSLPVLIETAPDPVANAAPYLHADPVRTAAWAERLADLPGLKVGVVWAGGYRPEQPTLGAVNKRRSMTLAALAPLAAIPGVSLISLQKGGPAEQVADLPDGMVVHDFTDELNDFSDTAALVQALDLVISVDTAVAHLAGGLGKPVWLMNRFDSCWRWLTDRRDSPWYPTLTLFGQPAPGDWNAVVADIASVLEALAA